MRAQNLPHGGGVEQVGGHVAHRAVHGPAATGEADDVPFGQAGEVLGERAADDAAGADDKRSPGHVCTPQTVTGVRRRSSATETTATATPAAAMAAPTRVAAGDPSPASITSPPSAAPTALPRLNAPMFAAAAIVPALPAASITLVCRPGAVAKAAAPTRNSVIAAGIGEDTG